MVWKYLLFIWIAAAMVLGFTWAPVVPYLEETPRVIYFHVPAAWVTVLALGWSMVHSVLYLRGRDLKHDDQAAAAAELGVMFCLLATISGSLWAKAQWGSYWNWDPRETTIFFLLLVYGAYLAIRGAVEEPGKRARLSAVYSAVAFVAVPFLIFVVPRIYSTLHPSPILPASGSESSGGMDPRIRLVFWSMVAGFTGLFFWVLSLRVRLGRLERETAA